MFDSQLKLKAPATIAFIVIAILLLGAFIFYRERMLFCDAPYMSFFIINEGKLQIQVFRYGSFITQIVPLLASKAGLALKWVLLLYSVSFNLFYLLTAAFLYRIREYALLLLWAFYLTLFVTETYYWTNNEVHQGIAWLFLGLGSLSYFLRKEKVNYAITVPLFALLSFLAISSHLLVVFAAAYLYLFLTLAYKGNWLKARNILLFGGTVLLCILWKYLSSKSKANFYDSGIFERMFEGQTFIQVIKKIPSPTFYFVIKELLRTYWIFSILLIWGITGAISRKKYFIVLATLVSIAVVFCLLSLAFETILRFHLESELMLFTVLGLALFTWLILPGMRVQFTVPLIVAIFAVKLVYIWKASDSFTNRIRIWEYAIAEMKQRGIHKVALDPQSFDNTPVSRQLLMSWAAPVETMYLSMLNNEPQLYTVAIPYFPYEEKIQDAQKDFVLPWTIWQYEKLNQDYFSKWHTSETYEHLDAQVFFANFRLNNKSGL